VLSSFCTRGYGCELRTRHSLRPLISEGGFSQQLGRDPRREAHRLARRNISPLAKAALTGQKNRWELK
jgi:hypothetical protein